MPHPVSCQTMHFFPLFRNPTPMPLCAHPSLPCPRLFIARVCAFRVSPVDLALSQGKPEANKFPDFFLPFSTLSRAPYLALNLSTTRHPFSLLIPFYSKTTQRGLSGFETDPLQTKDLKGLLSSHPSPPLASFIITPSQRLLCVQFSERSLILCCAVVR